MSRIHVGNILKQSVHKSDTELKQRMLIALRN